VARETSDYERRVLPHLDAAYNLARWLVRDQADDVVQEAMLRAWRARAQVRGEVKPWLLQIVRHVAYGVLVARGKSGEVAIDAGAEAARDPAPDPEALLSHAQDRARLDRALAGLPVELRECLVLRELEELSYKEIAQVSGVPIGTVMSRLWRARQALMGGGT
jgi:RNA polymerase sigma-70 factor (ECF subfamily)